MAEAEVKTINGKSVCDETARAIANAAVKTVNGISPDEHGNVVVSADENTIRAYVEEMLIGFVRENWTLTYTDLGKSLLQISVSNALSTQWIFTLEDNSVVTKNIGYQDGMIDFTKLLILEIPEGKVRLVQNGDVVVWERAPYPEKKPFSVMSWAEIGVVCEAGLASEYWAIGDEKTVALSTGEELTFLICAFDHDVGEDRNPLAMTLVMMHLMEVEHGFTNNGNGVFVSWNDSSIRSYLNETVYPTLPDDLRAIIKPTIKTSAERYTYTDTMETLDTLWLPSVSEVGLSYDGCLVEGNTYSQYTKIFRHIRKLNNGNPSNSGDTYWWTRSCPVKGSYAQYVTVISGISTTSRKTNYSSCGVCFGFCV